MIKNVLFLIIEHSDIFHSRDFAFKNLKFLTDDKNLKSTFFKSYDECLLKKLNKSIRKQLKEYIVSTSNMMILCFFIFFTECANFTEVVRVDKRHIFYANVLNARTVHYLRFFIIDFITTLDNNVYVLTTLYHNSIGMLWIYVIQTIVSSSFSENFAHSTKLEYRMILISRFNLTLFSKSFRDEIRTYKNAKK